MIRALPLMDWEVRAILAGHKTHLIAPVIPQLSALRPRLGDCPWGVQGDLLWVQEEHFEDKNRVTGETCSLLYKSDQRESPGFQLIPWRCSTYMLQHQSRLTLELATVRHCRFDKLRMLECMGNADWFMLQERGMQPMDAKAAFHQVFDMTFHKFGLRIGDNPMFWVARFEAAQVNIRELWQKRAA